MFAHLTGESIHDDFGERRFGKHSWRSSGAVFLSALGIDVHKIQLLARCNSPIVVHYTRLAPLKAITTEFKMAAQRKALDQESDRGSSWSRDDALKTFIDDRITDKITTDLQAHHHTRVELVEELRQ